MVGSIVWVINGFIVFLPEINSRKYPVNDTGVGWTGWLGATIFEFGAATALYEAMNRCVGPFVHLETKIQFSTGAIQ